MIKSKLFVASGVAFASLVLVFGLLGWLRSVSPLRVAQADGLLDTAVSDFALGAGCSVQSSGGLDGELILSPTIGSDFSGSVLPTGWFSATGSSVVIGDGVLTVTNGTAYAGLSTDVNNPTLYGPTLTVQFSATFVGGGGSQFAGFGLDHFAASPRNPFAIFSLTDNNNLRVRSFNDSGTSLDSPTSITTNDHFWENPHQYQIDWGISSVIFSVDQQPVVTHTIMITDMMRPQFYDDATGGGSIIVDWVRVPCTFESRVFDSGIVSSGNISSTFKGLTTTVTTPAGTSIVFEVITSTNGTDWLASTWTSVNPDGTFNVGPSQFIKYRATLSTTAAMVTPTIQSVRLWGIGPNGSGPNAIRLTSLSVAELDYGSRGLLIGVSAAGLAIGGASAIFRRRRMIG